MALTVSLGQMETQTRRLADLENALKRFPQAEVWQYVNQGIRYVYRAIITAQDRPFYQKDWSIITKPGVNVYPLAIDFVRLMSVLWCTSPSSNSGPWVTLDPIEEAERATYLNAGYYGGGMPRGYDITGGGSAFTQGTIPTAYSIELLPAPPSGRVAIRYVPSPPLLLQSTDTFDGILGFEDAACAWAAVLMRRKDDLPTDDLERDVERMMGEVRMIARRRDARPSRVQLTRNSGRQGRNGFRGRW